MWVEAKKMTQGFATSPVVLVFMNARPPEVQMTKWAVQSARPGVGPLIQWDLGP